MVAIYPGIIRGKARIYSVGIEELTAKNPKAPELVIACAIVLPDFRMIVGRTHEECHENALKFAGGISTEATLGFLTSAGLFITPEEAGMMAYRSRQTTQYLRTLKGEDIF